MLSVLNLFILSLLTILSYSKHALASNQCGTAAKVETYLETASDLIDRVRDSLPQDGDLCKCPPKPMDCEEVLSCGNNKSGVYKVYPRNRILVGGVQVFCDMDTDGGGWTVFQRRGDYKRPIDYFYKPWKMYKQGFGDLKRDFWLGNDIIYALTNQRPYFLRVDLKDFENSTRYAVYDQFWMDNEGLNYTLHVSDYSGDAGDSLSATHNGQRFSTFDRDNDNITTVNCAETYKGGWWYAACHSSNLNGLYLGGKHSSYADGVGWSTWKGHHESLKDTEMKLRSLDFQISSFNLGVEPK